MAITTNLTIDQGADFEAVIKLYSTNTEPLNLTNYGATGQIRRGYDSTTASGTFAITMPTPSNGELVLSLSATSSAELKYGRYVYDVLITNSSTGIKTRAVEGIVTVTPRVTR